MTMFSDCETDYYDGYDWDLFATGSFFMTIVMMNLLIAIIGDKFEQVMTSIVPSQYKQLYDIVLVLETFNILWTWNSDITGQSLPTMNTCKIQTSIYGGARCGHY